jgi:putative glutamine amidotransferase
MSLDFESDNPGYSVYPWYALREHYVSSIAQSGGVPLPLPHQVELAETYLEMLDGLVVTGGDFDVSPEYYGQSITSDKVSVKERRTQFELAMIQGMLQRNKPILGICGGQQLLAVALGCTLIQHIPDTIPNPLEHEQPNPRNEVGHAVQIKANTLLADIVKQPDIMVNSAHHQAVDQVGHDVIINAVAPDGVIEGIEHAGYRFCLGVQWHPEFQITEADRAINHAFVNAASPP